MACLTKPKFSPAQGVTDSLIASGSRRFEGLPTNPQWNLRDIITDIGRLEAATTQLIERLDSRRRLL